MFSGIIYHQAKILKKQGGIYNVGNPFGEILEMGESIAHNGACMTITYSDEDMYEFQAVEESLARTNLGALDVGDMMHVERSIRFDQRLDGHLLSGHIDGAGEVVSKESLDDGSKKLTILYPEKNSNLIVEKGWIAIDGVSLTIVDDLDCEFSVVIVPATSDLTHLGELEIGDHVNLEYDLMAKHIVKLFTSANSELKIKN